MKNILTISLPNKKCDKNGIYKNYLLKRLALTYPELLIDGIDTEETPFSYQYIGPSDKIRFGADLYSACDVAKYRKCTYCPFAEENYSLATQFELAMKNQMITLNFAVIIVNRYMISVCRMVLLLKSTEILFRQVISLSRSIIVDILCLYLAKKRLSLITLLL